MFIMMCAKYLVSCKLMIFFPPFSCSLILMVISYIYWQMLLLQRLVFTFCVSYLQNLIVTHPFILQFQYGNPDQLCSPLVQAKKNGEDLVVCSHSTGHFLEILFTGRRECAWLTMIDQITFSKFSLLLGGLEEKSVLRSYKFDL